MTFTKQPEVVTFNIPAHAVGCPATTMVWLTSNPDEGVEVWECDDLGGCGYSEVRFVGFE